MRGLAYRRTAQHLARVKVRLIKLKKETKNNVKHR
mgnify:CR=1 FL=1